MQYHSESGNACCHAMACALEQGRVRSRAVASPGGGSTEMCELRFEVAMGAGPQPWLDWLEIQYCCWCGVGLNPRAEASLRERGLRA